jgi:ATP-dependent Lhr-like helicase
LPFWFGEAPARTRELSAAVARVRVQGRDPQWTVNEVGLSPEVARQLAEYLNEGERTLGAIPTPECVVLERFFDESGGMQLVLHAPLGGRINRAWGLALRKRFCRGFGFELQAAANEEAIVLSLGLQHSFPLEEVFDYLHPDRARDLLVQALLAAPMFGARWRWNVTRALLLPRTQGGKRVPTALLRMRAEDLLVQAFPQVLACPETLPPGEMPVPWEQPLVRQTIEDCLTEAMDVEGFLQVLRDLGAGRIQRRAVDNAQPSAFARGILNAMPYAFLDDAPLEERRTRAVLARRALDPQTADTLGALDPQAVARVREEAWPQPESAEELHESLLWMGYVTQAEAHRCAWSAWLDELRAAGRARREDGASGMRWYATEAPRDPVTVLRGRLDAIGPVLAGAAAGAATLDLPAVADSDRPLLLQLEAQGLILRCRIAGQDAWCERRLLARMQRYTLERLRREIEPVSAGELWRFLACWQHADERFRLDGPRGVAEVLRKLAGFEAPAVEWESSILPDRVRDYRPEWLDQLTLSGEIAWGRLWGAGNPPVRSTPICLLPREDLHLWLELASRTGADENRGALSSYAQAILETLHRRGASFTQDLERATGLLPSHFEMGLTELIGQGLVTCDSFSGLRRLLTAPSRRSSVVKRTKLAPAGRWSGLRSGGRIMAGAGPQAAGEPAPGAIGALGSAAEPAGGASGAGGAGGVGSVGSVGGAGGAGGAFATESSDQSIELAAGQLLRRYGVVFRKIIERERLPVPWRDLVRVFRRQELRGEIRGGRFVQRFAGEQYALPEAVELLRRLRRRSTEIPPHGRGRGADGRGEGELEVSAADPLNLQGVLTPEPRVPALGRKKVLVRALEC